MKNNSEREKEESIYYEKRQREIERDRDTERERGFTQETTVKCQYDNNSITHVQYTIPSSQYNRV